MIRAGALILCAGGACAQGIDADPDVLTEVEAGVFCTEETGERLPAPGSVAGHSNLVAGIELRARSLVVPAEPGLSFGFQGIAVADVPVAQMRIVHPPFRGSGATEQWFDRSIDAGDVEFGIYAFDEAYELVPGLWRFELTDGSRTLASIELRVVPQEMAPHLVGLCEGDPKVSAAPRPTAPA